MQAAEELLRAQEVSQVDLLQARIEANSAKLTLSNAQNQQQAAWRQLAVVVGMPDLAPAKIQQPPDDRATDLVWQSTLQHLLQSSPEVARAEADVERAKCALARELAGRVPDVDIQAGARYASGPDDALATAGFSFPLLLYDRNQGNIYQARAELAATRQEVQRVRLDLENRLAAAFNDYAQARQQVERYEIEILLDAQKSLELVQQAYRQGEFSYLELLTAQRTYFRTNLAYVQAYRDLQVGRTRIENMLLVGALQAPGS
jgi:cobalt-zinc-cadmium efflux system outer membrane protein